MQAGVYVTPCPIIQKHGLHLGEGAKQQEDVEDLVALPDKMALPREPFFGIGIGEKKGPDQEKKHMALVIQNSYIHKARGRGGVNAVKHRADIQSVRHSRWHLLAEPAQQGREVGASVFGITGTSTGQPSQQDSPGHVEAHNPGVPARLNGVIEMHQGTAVLVRSNAHIVQEEEGVMPELGLGLQEVC